MKTRILTLCIATALAGTAASAASPDETIREILTLERRAMDGWLKGDPEPLLALSDSEITYFHVMTEKRLDGLPAVKAIVEPFRGLVLFDSYDMLEPKVQLGGDMAVLTYILARRNGSTTSRWNATQVYQRRPEGWRIIHTHWSMTQPPMAPSPQK